MTTIIGLAGSLRKQSYNRKLLRAAAELAPEGVTIAVESIEGIPLYNGDVESAEGIPAIVARLKDRIASSDGLLLVTPEYNNSIPGPFKNAIDWLTRPPKDIARVFHGRPVGVIGATPGSGGTRLSQTAWLPVLRTLSTRPFFGKSLYLAKAGDAFDESGRLADGALKERLAQYVTEFARFVAG